MKKVIVSLVGLIGIFAMFAFLCEPSGELIDKAWFIKQLISGAVIALCVILYAAMDMHGWFNDVDNRA